MSEKKKRGKEFDNPYSVAKAVTKGNALTKLSMVVLDSETLHIIR